MADDRWDEVADWYGEENAAGDTLLDELRALITTYVVLSDEHSVAAVALWIATSHTLPAHDCAPRLAATSPDKRCGKSRLLDIISGTCHKPLATVNATVPAIFRSIGGQQPPTLLIDEADTIFGNKRLAEQHEDLRALLNAGHQRGRPALRCVGPSQIPTEFPTFAMAAVAGIGRLPDTITDRAVNISMRRRHVNEKVAQFRARRDGPVLEGMRARLASWAGDHMDELSKAEPDMPVEDRAADTWEPLIAVADAAGGHWPETARAACKALVARADTADEEQSDAVRLLADIRAVFKYREVPFLPSADLVSELRRIEESPWNDYELNPSKLAARVKAFGVKPQRNTVGSIRGYSLEALTDAFKRYLRQDPSDPSETSSEQVKPSDTQKASDTPTRQTESTRQTETAAQRTFTDALTSSDGGTAQIVQECRHCGGPLTLPSAQERGYCSRARCLKANTNGQRA